MKVHKFNYRKVNEGKVQFTAVIGIGCGIVAFLATTSLTSGISACCICMVGMVLLDSEGHFPHVTLTVKTFAEGEEYVPEDGDEALPPDSESHPAPKKKNPIRAKIVDAAKQKAVDWAVEKIKKRL